MRTSTAMNRLLPRSAFAACCLAIAVCLLAAAPVAPAAGKAGRLDRGFNGDGKVVTVLPQADGTNYVQYRMPFEFAAGRIAVAVARGNKIVAANGKAIVMYLPNGRRNPRFGGGGAVPIEDVQGFRFQLADIAVDSQGRVLVAGTTKPTARVGMIGPPAPGPIPSKATIRRYLPSGELDPSFGSAGTVSTDLGAKPATFEGQSYPEAAVGVVGLTVDGADRPVVTGSAVEEVGGCGGAVVRSGEDGARYERSQAFVARLTVNGAPDQTFAGNGLRTIGGLSWLGSPIPTKGGGVLSSGAKVEPCKRGGPANPSVLANLAGDGNLSQGFGANGFWSRRFTRIAEIAPAPGGKLVLLVRNIELVRGNWVESRGEVIRLRPSGAFDTGFGTAGQADLSLPKRGSVATIAADRQGRVVLAGTVFPKRRGKKSPSSRFLLMRLAAGGNLDRGFGRRGRVATGFGRRTNVQGTEILIDGKGRIAVAGKFSGPSTGSAFALARYLGGR
jgi:uncharacterized delta-60 repeat protein